MEGYHTLLIGADQKEGAKKVPTKEEHTRTVGSIAANSKKDRELYNLNEVASVDLFSGSWKHNWKNYISSYYEWQDRGVP